MAAEDGHHQHAGQEIVFRPLPGRPVIVQPVIFPPAQQPAGQGVHRSQRTYPAAEYAAHQQRDRRHQQRPQEQAGTPWADNHVVASSSGSRRKNSFSNGRSPSPVRKQASPTSSRNSSSKSVCIAGGHGNYCGTAAVAHETANSRRSSER